MYWQLTHHLPLTTDHSLLITYRLSLITCHPPSTTYQPKPTTHHLALTTYHIPPTTHNPPHTIHQTRPTTYHPTHTTHHTPPTIYQLPLTTFHLPSTTHHLPPTTYYHPLYRVHFSQLPQLSSFASLQDYVNTGGGEGGRRWGVWGGCSCCLGLVGRQWWYLRGGEGCLWSRGGKYEDWIAILWENNYTKS